MICRLWHGWTTRENADAYERIVRGQVIPGIEGRGIAGFRHIDLMRRDLGGEIEFQTLMWFDDLEAVKRFMGDDYSLSHVRRRRAPFSRASTSARPTTRSSIAARNRRPDHAPQPAFRRESAHGREPVRR